MVILVLKIVVASTFYQIFKMWHKDQFHPTFCRSFLLMVTDVSGEVVASEFDAKCILKLLVYSLKCNL